MGNGAVYSAFLQAADHLSTHKESYKFETCDVPQKAQRETGQACAYGWVSHFAAEDEPHVYWGGWTRTEGKQLENYDTFSLRMSSLQKWWEFSWYRSRRVAAECLRRYAEKYHRPQAQVLPFKSVA